MSEDILYLGKFLDNLKKFEKDTDRFGQDLAELFNQIRRSVVGAVVEQEITLKIKEYEVK